MRTTFTRIDLMGWIWALDDLLDSGHADKPQASWVVDQYRSSFQSLRDQLKEMSAAYVKEG